MAGGMVRVIHRATETMALLRGHALEVVDLKFMPGKDIVASVANDENVYVWRLTCSGTDIRYTPAPILHQATSQAHAHTSLTVESAGANQCCRRHGASGRRREGATASCSSRRPLRSSLPA